jgi:hypothetical protein
LFSGKKKKKIHLAFVPSDNTAKEFVTFLLILQLLANVHLLLFFFFFSEHLGNPLHTQLVVSEISNYHLRLLLADEKWDSFPQ